MTKRTRKIKYAQGMCKGKANVFKGFIYSPEIEVECDRDKETPQEIAVRCTQAKQKCLENLKLKIQEYKTKHKFKVDGLPIPCFWGGEGYFNGKRRDE